VIEAQYIIYDTDSGASYRVRPNPDADEVDGSAGLIIEYRDDATCEWDRSFFIAPSAAPHVAEALARFFKRAA